MVYFTIRPKKILNDGDKKWKKILFRQRTFPNQFIAKMSSRNQSSHNEAISQIILPTVKPGRSHLHV
jgi:hypothetical protein